MKKFRIGIIGTENFHASSFIEYINKPDDNGNFRYPDCRVTLIYGHYPEASEALLGEYGAEKTAESIEEMVNNVDAVMITARDGRFHYEFAKPFIEAGIPAFIDKPFTVDAKQAAELIRIAKEKKVPLCGGSSLKFADTVQELSEYVKETQEIKGGSIAAPVQMGSEYSGFYFYASHLVEMTLEIFGYKPLSVSAVRNKSGVCATVNYKDFSVTNHFNDGLYHYSATLFSDEGIILKAVDLSTAAEKECDEFVNMLRTGEMNKTYEELIIPVYYMQAVEKAYETGETIKIKFDF